MNEFLGCGHLLNDGVPYLESALVQKGLLPLPQAKHQQLIRSSATSAFHRATGIVN
jgi:hypothetical protein